MKVAGPDRCPSSWVGAHNRQSLRFLGQPDWQKLHDGTYDWALGRLQGRPSDSGIHATGISKWYGIQSLFRLSAFFKNIRPDRVFVAASR